MIEESQELDKMIEEKKIELTETQVKEKKRAIWGRVPVSDDHPVNYAIVVELPLSNTYDLDDIKLSAVTPEEIKNLLRITKYSSGLKDAMQKYLHGDWIKYDKYFDFWEIDMACPSEGDTPMAIGIVCYREKNSSIMLAELLENEGVPFNVLSGFTPFSHPLFRDVIAVMDALESPLDRKCMLNLYKVLPITREQMQYAAGYNPKTKKFDDVEQMPFWRLDYGSAYNRAGFGDCMELLKTISMGIGKIPMKNYFNTLLSMICKYHWNFIRKSRENLEVYDDYIESKVKTIFNVDYLYKEVYNRFSQRKDICRRNQEGRVGVTLSTFHSLKGLEYKNVIIMDMDDSIFPKFSMLESRDYTEMQKKALKECETRLYYVAVTRAKDNLYIYYNQDNPSRYVALYKDDSKSTVSTDTSDMNFFNESFGDYDDFEDFEDFEDLPEENLIDSTESDTPDLTDTDLSNTSQVGQSSFLANLLKKI